MGSRLQTKQNTKMNLTSLTLFSLVLLTFLGSVSGLPSSSCSSSDCKTCLASCDSCDQCGLCNLCFGQTLGPCANCKYCDGGAKACKKTCNKGKRPQSCRPCIAKCS